MEIMQSENSTSLTSKFEPDSQTIDVKKCAFNAKNCTTEIFNFNFSQAVHILEQHLLSDHVFEGSIKDAIVSGYIILIIAGVITNLLVSVIIIFNPRLRVAKNLFIVNLTISDLMLCLFCMPFTLVELLNKQWNLGPFLCRGVPFVQGISIFVSSATVSAIALDRQNVIVSYNFQRNKRNKSNMVLYTCILWVFSLVLSLPIIFSKTVTSVSVAGMVLYEKCIEKWPSSHAKAMYTLLILTAQFIIPTIVLTMTHLRIKTYLNRSIRRHTTPRSSITSDKLLKELKRNNHATVILAFIFVVFASSWLPWNAFNLMADFELLYMKPENIYLAFAVCHLIAMTSSITNPILYGWFNNNIKREILRLKLNQINKFRRNRKEEKELRKRNGTFVLHTGTAGAKSSLRNMTKEVEECDL